MTRPQMILGTRQEDALDRQVHIAPSCFELQ
jgi:hypothetical protein